MKTRAKRPFEPVHPDPDAAYADTIDIDMSTLEPQVVKPGYVAWNSGGVAEVAGQHIDQAFIGSCANGRLSDFAVAAEIVKGKQVAKGTRFLVTPGSQLIYKEAVRAGYVETLVEAGAVVTNSTCGACFGGHMGTLGDGERAQLAKIATIVRFNKGELIYQEGDTADAAAISLVLLVLTLAVLVAADVFRRRYTADAQ